jgi:DNA-binding winged helix-turn-helix (wHTH) protein/TolB-like protein
MSDVRVIYEFCGFRADPLTRRLSSGGEHLALTPKAFETLLTLIANRGQIVSKNDLIDAVWADTVVEENNLTQQIAALRRVFGERAGEHRFIVTVPGRGYSFVAPVIEIDAGEELVVYEATRSTLTVDLTNEGSRFSAWFSLLNRERAFGSALALAYIFIVCVFAFWPLASGSDRPTQIVAVLTFRTVGGEDDALGVGIRDTLRAKLGSLEDVAVRPAMPNVPSDDVVVAGKQARADVVFTGSIQREDERVRVAIEMIDVNKERIVWGQTFDCERSRLFEMQDAIAGEAVRVIRASLL